ncbi:MAG: hypothetical protein JOZ62_07230 [Acidobacteriaceae bacterium]|nr:hypothetical protein [Acidobacteriaceae bacterium]
MAKAARKPKPVRLALVGAETLIGRELQEVLETRASAVAITSYASSGEGNFGEQEGEAVYLEALTPNSIRDDQAIIIAGTEEGATKAYEIAKQRGGQPLIIDCASHLEQEPEARIVAPLVATANLDTSWLLVIAHPAASALGLVLTSLGRLAGIRQAVANIFEPASERGKRGVSELHQQTTSLLNFKTLEKDVFDAQLGFNLLSQYGEAAAGKLLTIEERIERHLTTILGQQPQDNVVPLPSLRLIQAPVFHGYSISLWVEFETQVEPTEVGEALAVAAMDVRGAETEPPTNVGVVSQSGLIVGDVRTDRNNPRAVWIWIVGDNLRLTADAAAELVSQIKIIPE